MSYYNENVMKLIDNIITRLTYTQKNGQIHRIQQENKLSVSLCLCKQNGHCQRLNVECPIVPQTLLQSLKLGGCPALPGERDRQ